MSKEAQWDVLLLRETFKQDEASTFETRRGHVVYIAPRLSKPSSTSIVLNKNLFPMISKLCWDFHHTSTSVSFYFAAHQWCFSSAWAPREGQEREFDRSLEDFLNKNLRGFKPFKRSRRKIFVTGIDANASLGEVQSMPQVGPHAFGLRTRRGDTLVQHITRSRLIAEVDSFQNLQRSRAP